MHPPQVARPPAGGLELLGPVREAWAPILSVEALDFVASLARRFEPRRRALLAERAARQARFDAGERPDFLKETVGVRSATWRVAPPPRDLESRRVEITGPVDRKMVINALNSGADVFMADFEDATSPTWENLVQGQLNLFEAVRRSIRFTSPEGKEYRLAEKTATLMARPRGWHLEERHVRLEGRPISGALFDCGLYLFHNARELAARGSGPYLYLPKLESHLEARLWNEVFLAAQAELGLPRGTVRATVLIETLPAAFEMDEILFELREHSAGLNCGRWDYIFSFIKKLRRDPKCVLPDRGSVGMTQHFLRSYSLLLIRTCHRRGAHAMGGMAAQIPDKRDPEANRVALERVVADKKREAEDGHDGTWVAHPGLVEIARAEFEHKLGHRPHQMERARDDVQVSAEDLLRVPSGPITEAGLRQNVAVGVQYLAAWLCGNGCVPLYGLMEDAATAEISRTQLWQWRTHGARLSDGRAVSAELLRAVIAEELDELRESLGPDAYQAGRFEPARELFERLVLEPELYDFLTLPAYERILSAREPERSGEQSRPGEPSRTVPQP